MKSSHRRLLAGALALPFFAAALVTQLGHFGPAAKTAQVSAPTAAVCLVPPGNSPVEVTITVPTAVVPALLAQTRSYEGVCADYGAPLPLGDGTVRTYSQIEGGKPAAVGVTFPRTMLAGLPNEMTDTHHCYDVNGDGKIVNDMTECAGGYERELTLPAAATQLSGLPLTWALVNWNSHGHGAPGVYDVPHFDFHFYIQPEAERDAIRPGPCGIVVNCADYATGSIPVPAQNMPADYSDLKFVEVAMGNHLLDQTSPEWNGVLFTRTFIYGSYAGRISFLEPMITLAFLQGVFSGQTPGGCWPIKQPQAWQQPGWYPQQYCVRYRANRDDFTVSLENFRR